MLDVFRRGQRWWTAAVVVFVGGVFAVFIGLGGPLQRGGGGAVLQVGPHRIGPGEFFRVRAQREEQFRQALGDSFDPRQHGDALDSVTAQILVQRSILAIEAERIGLTVSKREVESEILTIPGLRDENGRFDKTAFDRWVAYEFGSEKAFREQQERAALAGKLLRVLRSQAYVSEAEARAAVEQRLEGVQLAFVVLDPTRIPDDFARDPGAIQELLATREDEIRRLYEERAEQYDVPEQVRARHILVRVPETASPEEEDAARLRIEAAAERLGAGEPFGPLAEELSEDPGSAANGGDLGFFRRGQMVAAFEEAAFALEPGGLSEPVRTPFGFHLIQVEDRKAAEHRPFDSVKEDLTFEVLGRGAAQERVRQLADELSAEVAAGQSLESAARAAGLTLERTAMLRRRPDGFVPGLGAAPELMAVAFSLEPGESSSRVFVVGERFALVQVMDREAPDPELVAASVPAERERLAEAEVEALAETWIRARRERLAADGELIVDFDAIGRG